MEDEFIYWPPPPVGIKVEEISGMESKSGIIWRELAMQIYCENGRGGFREIGHFPNGYLPVWNDRPHLNNPHRTSACRGYAA